MGKSSAPPPPDYTPLAMAAQTQMQMSNEQLAAQQDMSREQFDIARGAYAQQDRQAQQQYDLARQAFQTQSGQAQQQYDLLNKALQTQTGQSQQQYDLARQAFDSQSAMAEKQYGLQTGALDWARKQYETDQATNKGIIDSQMATQQELLGNARKAQNRYETIYQPLENSLVQEAQQYASPEQRALKMGAASGQVAQQFDAQRRAAMQNLEGYGIDPSSTRYAALDVGVRTAQAAAQAAAANVAGEQTDAIGRALRADAINVGRGLPSDVNAGANASLNAGQSAVNAGLATTGSGANTMGTSVQYGNLGQGMYGNALGGLQAGTGAIGAGNGLFGTALGSIGAGNGMFNSATGAIGAANGMFNSGTGAIGAGNGMAGQATGALNAWGSALNNGYQNQIAAVNANNSASSGIGSLLGIGASFIPGLAGGGTVPAAASPTHGRAIDDVDARLTPGEFVVPKDVVQWKGEEFFQRLAAKTREDRHKNSPAQPRMMAVPAGRQPAFVSRSALPTR